MVAEKEKIVKSRMLRNRKMAIFMVLLIQKRFHSCLK